MILALLTATAVGVLTGIAGHALLRRRASLPWFLPVAVSTAAATGGTSAAWLVRDEPVGLAVVLLSAVLFAATALIVVAVRTTGLARRSGE